MPTYISWLSPMHVVGINKFLCIIYMYGSVITSYCTCISHLEPVNCIIGFVGIMSSLIRISAELARLFTLDLVSEAHVAVIHSEFLVAVLCVPIKAKHPWLTKLTVTHCTLIPGRSGYS